MRALIAVVAVMSCLPASALAEQAGRTIVSDIEMSEFTPPLELTINIDSGEYSIMPPATGWPSSYPKRDTRRGKVTGSTLAQVRKAFDRTMAAGVTDQKCLAANGRGYDVIISNAGVAHMALTEGGRRMTTAPTYMCWTRAALALHRELAQTFDFKSPT